MSEAIEIVEVGARDGLQNEKAILEAADKVDFIHRLRRAAFAGSRLCPSSIPAACRRWLEPRRS